MNPPTFDRWRGLLWQVLLLALLAAALGWLAHNTAANMAARGIRGGFDFLLQRAGFDIGEKPIAFDAAQAYWRAFLIGLLNTLRVALPGVLLATLIGTAVGLARLSKGALLRAVGTSYVDVFRNVPLLLQLLMVYGLYTALLPAMDAPRQLGPLRLDKAGLQWGADPLTAPALTPEYLALLTGLVLYTAAFVAEIVRAGVLAISRGQGDAARALGMNGGQTMRHVVLPQALRVIVPPLTNQYLNLTKNSSLAVAIGYPDLVSIANTALNQTGRAVECLSLVMAVYLVLSLATAFAMSRVNARAALRHR